MLPRRLLRPLISTTAVHISSTPHSVFHARCHVIPARPLHSTASALLPIRSPVPDIVLPRVSIAELVVNCMEKFGDERAVTDAEDPSRTLTYAELLDLSARVAGGLRKDGLKQKDVVLIFLPNCPEYIVALLGIERLGAIMSGCNNAYTKEELLHQVNVTETQRIITNEALLPVVREVAKEKNIKQIYVVRESQSSSDTKAFERLYDNEPLTVLPQVSFKEDIAFLPFSSGTTRVAKGVMITHQNAVAETASLDTEQYGFALHRGSTTIAVLPIFHIYGLCIVLRALHDGWHLVTMPAFKPEQYLDLIQQYKIPFIFTVPPIVLLLAKHPMALDYDLSSLQQVLCGAAPLGPDICEEFKHRFPDKMVMQGYGLTETTAALSISQPSDGHVDPTSAGKLAPNTEAMIVNDDGEEVGCNEAGELLVRGPLVMRGYYRNEQATADIFDKNGWMRTGDVARVDENGQLYITDRMKELIKVKGFQVPPAELEDLLLSHELIADAAVIGVPNDRSGEVPRAYVVLKQNANLEEKEVQQFVEDRVARHKRLVGGVAFVKEVPKSPSGKILRRLLRDQLSST